jgi:membrane-bound lytic murein transglycosylase D
MGRLNIGGYFYGAAALVLINSPLVISSFAHDNSENEEETPVTIEKMARPQPAGLDHAWVSPDFSGQDQALGHQGAATFDVPAGMEDQVLFWRDIYTKFTTDQGVLHDSRYINLIYETVDFSDLAQNLDFTPSQREKARRKRVKEAKKMIEERLIRLAKLKSPEGLDGDDLRYWNYFSNVDEANKFSEAQKRGRLRFQLGQRDQFMEGIYQSGRHLREMEEIFRREGLPIELTRLPFVESSFNLKARSRVGASGIWQFMRATARGYLRMDSSIDERNDPLRATVAAARNLRSNFQMLKSWPLAITGWNAGPSGVQRLVRRFKTDDIAQLTELRRGRFGFASANFYASFIAALMVERSAEQYFGPLKQMAELRGQEVRLEKPMPVQSLIDWFDGDLARAQSFNPGILSGVWPNGSVQSRSSIRVPFEKVEIVESALKIQLPRQPTSVEPPATPPKTVQAN